MAVNLSWPQHDLLKFILKLIVGGVYWFPMTTDCSKWKLCTPKLWPRGFYSQMKPNRLRYKEELCYFRRAHALYCIELGC